MNKRPVIKEVIVVEGKDDTQRLQRFLNVDTIETNGSALDGEVFKRIALAQKLRGVIVFTDPDFSGEKIRKMITEQVPEVKHAFISRQKSVPKRAHGSLGVEHADQESIMEALRQVMTPSEKQADPQAYDHLLHEYRLLGGKQAKKHREQLGEKLNIGYTNGKQLRKRLAMFAITPERLKTAMEEIILAEREN